MTDRIESRPAGNDGAGLPAVDPVVAPLPKKDSRALPLFDCEPITVFGEDEKRLKLMETVEIDDQGIAHEIDEATGTRTRLVAVRITDAKDAEVLPFTKTNEGIAISLTPERATRIGFFLGSSESDQAAIRQGEYPGIPLTTRSVLGPNPLHEVFINLGGIKPSELEEAFWAEQVGLFERLGFDPATTRGIFHRSHLPTGSVDAWKTNPLVYLPDESADMLPHFDGSQVQKDRLQIQVYGKKPVIPQIAFRSGYDSNPFSTDNLRFGATKGFTLGFGRDSTQYAKTTPTSLDGLKAAYQIDVVEQVS